MINAVDMMYGQLISMNGLDALVDGKTARVLISETSKDEIVTDQPLHEGSLIKINEDNYLIISMSEQFNQGIYKIGQFEKTLPILLGSSYKPLNAVVKKYRGEFVDGTYINEVHDQYTFKISKADSNMNSQSIGNDLIVYDGGLYNILSIDNTHDGILILTGKYDTVYVPHTYTMTLNSTAETLVQGDTFQIVITATDNGTVVSNPQLTFVSSDESIATVSNGLVSVIGVGNCTISVSFNNVSAELTIIAEEKPVEPVISYSYSFSQSITALKTYMTTTLSCFKYLDSVQDSSLKISYSWDSTTQSLISSGKIVVTVKSDSSISIKNASITSTTYAYLTVIDTITQTKILDAVKITLTGM
ncbi:hypothetical protein [Clostridium beijerinckii]|uniref:BIG2 domain-containing protein n=1 Tax=Clostridium beijerinckii TaxID=1520 RepID=A0AAE5H8R6_CLOBE|nr:hypothetical protein [Clostridium beijerinckii]NSB17423.1 hypothetical protein [Clostridium beijerinckii]OOM28465.1 hypothetical protein CLOBE_27210 [Clostridium beijerinckii]